ncbi:MAG: xanthine dehydrogenase molybdopterin binding subunit [Gemmataceae bacterium]
MSAAGRDLPHDSAREHVTGEAVYIDDMPPFHGELFVGILGSPVAHGKITNIDLEACRKVAGVVAAYTWRDVPGHNEFGPVFHDEELLAKDTVQYLGQPIAVIAGESREVVDRAIKLAIVKVESLPPVVSIEEAIKRSQFIATSRCIARGDAAAALQTADHCLTGEVSIGGQEHFYLESQAALAIPEEAGSITVHSSTQNPTEIQSVVAHCLGLPMSAVVCVCRRMGGGFGGKETQGATPAILAAMVAHNTRRPARCVYGHEQDFRTTGKRHPYLARYQVGFTNEGRITSLVTDFYSNGGFSADLSLAVLERTLLHAENAYYIPNEQFTGTVCRTNLPSNTAFRGFGGPQGVAAVEHIIEEIAAYLSVDSYQIRRLNCYGRNENNVTPYGQVIPNNVLPTILDQLVTKAEYESRRAEIARFNAKSRTYLKGIAVTPVKFGISFTRRTLNQGNALVNIYLDGTVQVSTGGTEMGQGLYTKVRQLVADQFGLPVTSVRMMATSTEKNNNTSPTAASAGTDLNGTAAVRACEQIRQRLAIVAAPKLARDGLEASPENVVFADGHLLDRRDPTHRITFKEVVALAYEARIDLGARGFYATPGVDFNRELGRGTPFYYFTNGAAVTEVLIDRFTGDVTVTRADLLMDLGRMINPAIDRGQVVGGFVQGLGWVTTEALVYGDDGALLSDSATTYKIPNATDVPTDFRVDFFENPEHRDNIFRSKAVGEPPLLLAVSAWAAVKQALAAATGSAALSLPATNEEVLRRLSVKSGAIPSPSGNGMSLKHPSPNLAAT